MRRLLVGALLVFFTGSVYAGETEKQMVGRWYGALASVDRAAITDLLSDKAKITLGDLDIEQTKAEFIASLDEWEDAMKGSTIRHEVESDQAGVITAIVCYKFPDNESLGREVFAFEGGKIVSSEQETIAESCETFPG